MPRFCASMMALLVVGCARLPRTRSVAESVDSDSARVVALAQGSGFQLQAISVSSFPGVPFRIGAALLQKDTLARVLVVAIDSQRATRAYDALVTISGCGDPEPELPTVGPVVIAKHLLLRVQIERRELGCTGVSTTDFRIVHLLDVRQGFREVLSYRTDSLDYGDAEDVAPKAVVYRHLYDYPNVCIDDCRELSAVAISSKSNGIPQWYTWQWNADSTALVPVGR